MRFGVVFYNLGKICLVLAASMALPISFELMAREDVTGALVGAQLVMLASGLLFMLIFRYARRTTLRYRESFGIATFAWILAAALGSLPYIFSHM